MPLRSRNCTARRHNPPTPTAYAKATADKRGNTTMAKQSNNEPAGKKRVAITTEATNFLMEQPPAVIQEFQTLTDRLENSGRLEYPDAKKIAGEKGLFELRMKIKPHQYRFFYCYDDGSLIWVLSGFIKKTQKTPVQEIRKAKKIMRRYGL